MESYKFYKEYRDEYNRLQKDEIKYDSDVKRHQYLPYLDHIKVDIVDRYNKFILKRRFGFYSDQNNPNNYSLEEGRKISESDKISNYKEQYEETLKLLNEIDNNFYEAFSLIDYTNRNTYFTYQKICYDNISSELNRLFYIIQELERDVFEIKYKKYSLNNLVLILSILFIVFILLYNFYN